MKNSILTLAFIFSIFSVAAQNNTPKLTLDYLHRLNADIEKTPSETFQKYATEGFIFTNGNGSQSNKTDVVGLYATMIQETHTSSEEKIQQVGNTATITGKIHQRFLQKKDSKLVNDYLGMFTYTFVYQNNLWMLAAAQHTNFIAPKAENEAAIKNVIEGQTQASYDRNLEKSLSYWANVPHASYVLTSLNANLTGFEQIKNTYTFFIKTNPTPDKSKIETTYKSITIKSNTAFVKHEEAFTNEKGVTTKQNCHRYLEKINNEWKLVGSVVTPMPTVKSEDEAAIKSVILAETQAYLDGHPEKIKEYWSNKGSDEFQSQQIVAWIGQPFAKAETLNKLNEAAKSIVKKQEIKIDRDDFEIRTNKDMAWATYTQKAIANGTVAQTIRETRILERIGGEWKIVYVGEQWVK